MADEKKGRKCGASTVKAAPASGRRVAEAFQVANRTVKVGEHVEQQAGGAVCEASRWLCCRNHREDVRSERESAAGGWHQSGIGLLADGLPDEVLLLAWREAFLGAFVSDATGLPHTR